jgi:methionyl-tRNA formyltransferase
MKKSSSLIFFGNERLSSGYSPPENALTLKRLLDNGYHIAAVVANYEAGTSRNPRQLEIANVAQQYDIPLLLPKKVMDIRDELAGFGAAAGVLVAYGKIIPKAIIDLFEYGILNLHPSLLPRYRGSTPIEQAILDGAEQTGISIMSLVKEMDAGPVYAQKAVRLNCTESKQALTTELLTLGGDMLIEILPQIMTGELKPTPQDESKATYTQRIYKTDGIIDWSEPAATIERKVRAYSVWPKTRAMIYNHSVTILKARVAPHQNDGKLVMPCSDGFIEILELIAPSGRTMSGEAFLRGYKR